APGAKITNSTTTGGASWVWDFWYDSNNNGRYDASETKIGAPNPRTGTHSGATASLSGYSGEAVDGSKKRICTRLALSGPTGGATIKSPGYAVICKTIIRKPYISVLNGDINTTCGGGAINAFWNPAANNGSGTDLAVFAGGGVDQFVSAVIRDSAYKKRL